MYADLHEANAKQNVPAQSFTYFDNCSIDKYLQSIQGIFLYIIITQIIKFKSVFKKLIEKK